MPGDVVTLERWWTNPEYSQGNLEIPGQSRLSPAGRKILEDVSKVVDAGTIDLPQMPKAAMEASNLLRTIEPDLKAVGAVIERDPTLAAQILRVANSPVHGARVTIDNIQRAVNHVGARRLKTLVLEAAIRSAAEGISAKPWVDREQQFSVYCASIARALAAPLKGDAELCYLAGLLRDLGRMPLLKFLDKRQLLSPAPRLDDELEIILECLNRGVGRVMAAAWQLPPAVTDAIGQHLNGRLDDEDSLAGFPSTLAAEAAGDLCHGLGLGRQRRPFDLTNCRSLRDTGLGGARSILFFEGPLTSAIDQAQASFA